MSEAQIQVLADPVEPMITFKPFISITLFHTLYLKIPPIHMTYDDSKAAAENNIA